jgi:hypothetical protein
VSWASTKDIQQNESLNEYWKKSLEEEGSLKSEGIDVM